MKKFLLVALLIGFPSPLLADSTSGYKQTAICFPVDARDGIPSIALWKKEDANSKKWGVYTCDKYSSCSWADKAVSYDTAKDKYNEKSSKLPCNSGDLTVD